MRFQIQNDTHTRAPSPILDSGWKEAPAPGEAQIQVYGLAASYAGMLLVGENLQNHFYITVSSDYEERI